MPWFALSELDDLQVIRSFLDSDVNYAAYALGDLELPYSRHAHWFAASRAGNVDGLILIYQGLEPNVMFLMGDISALSALLLQGVGPDSVYVTARPDVGDVLRDFYHIDPLHQMFRMRINKGTFKALDGGTLRGGVDVLGQNNLEELIELVTAAAESDGRDLRDVPFAPQMIDDGYYRGIFLDSKLVAMGGTHSVANLSKMASVGNIVVHPDYRRQGLGSLVSNAVTESLVRDGFELIVLNVKQNNSAALKIYKKLGYKQVCSFIEGPATRR